MTEMPAGPYMNFFGRPGACGFIPPDIRATQGADKLVFFDLDAGAVVRRVSEQSVAAGLGAEGGLVEVTEPCRVWQTNEQFNGNRLHYCSFVRLFFLVTGFLLSSLLSSSWTLR